MRHNLRNYTRPSWFLDPSGCFYTYIKRALVCGFVPSGLASRWQDTNGRIFREDKMMKALAIQLWRDEEAQDIAEYAVMLAVILVIVVGTVRLIGGNANNVFSSVASCIS